MLTPKQIVERLERSLELLTGGTRDVPERQRTLRATIEWSYGLLAPEEQRLFAALAVFAGSFDLEAAETVTGGDLQTIAALVDKSLLRHTGEGRFFMLETIRDYAAECLEQSGLAEELRRRHADWVMALALAAREELRGDRQIAFLDRLSAEHANIRAALAFAISSRDAQTALTIGGSLGRFWVHRGHDPEGYRWLQAALALPQAVHDEPRWRALYWTAILADGLADENTAMAVSESALALARELDDAEAICASALELERKLTDEGDFQRAEALLEEAAARAAQEGLERTAALVAYQRGRRRLSAGELAAAAPDMETALDKMRQVGDLQAVVSIMAHLAFVEAACGRHAEGRELLRESLALSVDMRHALQIALCLEVSATLALEGGDSFGAAALLIRADGLLDSVGVGQPFGHVETELYYRRPWREVRAHLDDAKIESLRARTPLGDYDEAVAYANQYLAG